MISLEGTRTNANLKHAFSDEGRFDRLYLNHEQAAEASGHRGLAVLARASAGYGARYAGGHLDLLIADNAIPAPAGTSIVEFAAPMTDMIDEHTSMYAGMTRTAHDEGFEEIADWFETLAKAGRSHARRMRRALEKHASKI
jgi:rubrerythrin